MMNSMNGREGLEGQEGRERREGREMENLARWRAVLRRDRNADGEFVYGVRSTRIYCRPSCPSRKPTRSLVEFFETPADAEREGFRACKRCQPKAAALIDPWTDKIRRACVYLSNVEGQPSLATLA